MSPTGSSNGSCLHQGRHLRRRQPPKHARFLRKCHSDSHLDPGKAYPGSDSGGTRCFIRFDTFTDGVCSSPLSGINEGYEKNSKVLIRVTVEGSPGPLRIVIELGTTVDESIKLVIHKYHEEGRTPRLPKDAASLFDLHVSNFSLHCLERSTEIGETGNRSFYLRKTNSITSKYGSSNSSSSSSSLKQLATPNHNTMLLLFPPIIAQNMSKIIRKAKSLFKLLGCLDSL